MRRQEALEKTVMLGEVEGSRKRRWPNMRRIDYVKVAIAVSLQDLNKAITIRMFGRSWILKGCHKSETTWQHLHMWKHASDLKGYNSWTKDLIF